MMRTEKEINNSRELSVCYWIHNSDEREIYSSGYVGITNVQRFDKRMKEHRRSGKYKPEDSVIVVGRGTPKMVLTIEKHLRPKTRIGRNIRAGGEWVGFMKLTPEEIKERTRNHRATLAANPDIVKVTARKRQATLIANPEIMKESNRKHKATLDANPEIMKEATRKLKATLDANPEIMKESVRKRRATRVANPEIEKEGTRKRLATCKANPEIQKLKIRKFRATMKAKREAKA